jgi:hypothetical protein
LTPVHASGSSATAQDLSAIFGISSHKLVSTQGITASCSSSLPSSLGTVNAVGNALAGFTPPAAGRHEAWQCLATSQALGLSLQGAPPALFTLPGAASRTRLQIDSSGAKAHAQGRKLTPKSSAMLGDWRTPRPPANPDPSTTAEWGRFWSTRRAATNSNRSTASSFTKLDTLKKLPRALRGVASLFATGTADAKTLGRKNPQL